MVHINIRYVLSMDRRWGVVMLLDERHNVGEGFVGGLSGCHQISDELVSRCTAYTQQNSALLLCGLHIVSGEVVLQPLRVGLPVLLRMSKLSNTAVNGHSFTLVANL